jgi:hypothetical protein
MKLLILPSSFGWRRRPRLCHTCANGSYVLVLPFYAIGKPVLVTDISTKHLLVAKLTWENARVAADVAICSGAVKDIWPLSTAEEFVCLGAFNLAGFPGIGPWLGVKQPIDFPWAGTLTLIWVGNG